MDEIPKNFKLIDVIGQGDCAIDAILEGMKRHYNNDKIIIDKMNEYLDEKSKIKNIVLENNDLIKHNKETIVAFRNVLYNYYGVLLKSGTVTDQEIIFLNYKRESIRNPGVWLEIYDLNYISRLFDICIKLWFKPETKYVWGYIKPSFKINDPTEIILTNGFDKCKTIIYIRHNGSHYDLLLKDAGKKKSNGDKKHNSAKKANMSRKANAINHNVSRKSRTRKSNANTSGEKDQDNTLYNVGIGAIIFVIIIAFSY